MSYGIIDFSYGVIISTESEVRTSGVYREFYRAVALHQRRELLDNEWSWEGPIADWDDDALTEFVTEWMSEETYVTTHYTGGGDHQPCIIGITLKSWPYFNIGEIFEARDSITSLTPEQTAEFAAKVPQWLRDLMALHNLTPGFCWNTSTS